MARPQAFERSYPEALWARERAFLEARREQAIQGDRPPDDTVAVALSGGGIRSATFCLGVFQALARQKLVSRVDYLSTVSGGGYFGSFLGRLYTRNEIRSPADVEHLLDPERAADGRPDRAGPPDELPDVIQWLRDNGRYLSPNGAGDLLLGGAIMLRNWVAIHVVLLSLVLFGFLTAQVVRVGMEAAALRADGGAALGFCRWSLCSSHWIWWSPFLVVPAALLVAWAIPVGWAYWLTGRWRRVRWYDRPAAGVVAAALAALGVLLWGFVAGTPWLAAGAVSLAVIALTVIAWALAMWSARARGEKKLGGAEVPEEALRAFEIEEQRNRLSSWLASALIATGGSLAFAVIDSLGKTAYLAAMLPGSNLLTYVGGALSALAGVAAFAKPIATAVGGQTSGKRLRLPLSIVAGAGAVVIVGVLLLVTSMVAHAVAWRFQPPPLAPRLSWLAARPEATVTAAAAVASGGQVTVTTRIGVAPPVPATAACDLASSVACLRGWGTWGVLGLVWLVLGVFSLLFGRIWLFVNNSSLHSMYSARLTRAYLGASNPRRRNPDNESVTRVLPGDNVDAVRYWTLPPAGQTNPRKPPLHLINVTVNETMDGRSQVQQQDRKGLGMAIGPCAFSVGVTHHVVFATHAHLREHPLDVHVFPAAVPGPPSEQPFRVFRLRRGQWNGGEPLSIGAWVGVSGAAFSTGMGARTSLGLSLLCGFGNVRLGYWWDSQIERRFGSRDPYLLRAFEEVFPVQTYLLHEFLSRFYGTSRTRWYLSDGGHFENMGAYELIRRRLRRILLVDAEADPEYTFEGLANLVRKARIDFGAEITFLTAQELDEAVTPGHRYLFGTLEQLRRGRWSEEPVDDSRTGQARRSLDDPIDETRYSLAHAALARVRFADEPERVGWLVYLKPSLTGDEPADLTQYHRTHASFPQETTADQFFDEAQWESYRMLGFQIAGDVFGEGRAVGGAVPPGARTPHEIVFAP